MDKPDLLISIEKNHPTVSLEKIKYLVQEEIDKQEREAIIGMLKGKAIDLLSIIMKYVPKATIPTGQWSQSSNPPHIMAETLKKSPQVIKNKLN